MKNIFDTDLKKYESAIAPILYKEASEELFNSYLDSCDTNEEYLEKKIIM